MGLTDSQQRAGIYQFLAGAFLWPPTQDMLDAALDDEFIQLVADELDTEAADGLRQCKCAALKVEAVHEDFDALFRVPKGRYVTPFESVFREPYVDGKGRQRRRLMGETSRHVMTFYSAAGSEFERHEVLGKMPDFIGAELEFMRYLCEQEAEAAGRGDDDQATELRTLQRRFLDEHLAKWVDDLCDKIVAGDENGYFAAIAGVMRAFVGGDYVWMMRSADDVATA